jgi:hypothetical protein
LSKRYFKSHTDVGLGPGYAYIEFGDDEYASRQVEVYGDRWFSSFKNDYHDELGPALCDKPLSSMELAPEDEIDQGEFEKVWAEAVKRESS